MSIQQKVLLPDDVRKLLNVDNREIIELCKKTSVTPKKNGNGQIYFSIDEVKKELVSRIIDENIYNDSNDFDYYDEEEFEILDEIDDDILKSLDNDILDDDSYPVHKLEDYIEAFDQIQEEESFIDLYY